MRRVALLLGVALALLAAPGPASAHPLGNFSVNHLSVVRISDDRVDVRYVLDQAEIPTAGERALSSTEVIRRKLGEVRRGLALTVDGRPARLARVGAPRLSFPAGAGGLPTTRLELALRARVSDPARVELRDETFPDRVGWKAVVAAPGEGTGRTQHRARQRSHRRPPPLSERPAEQPGRPARGALQRGARQRDPDRTADRGRRELREPDRGERAGSHASSRTPLPAAACCCSCCWPLSGGARCTRSRRATARRWWPRTSWAPAAAPGTRSRSAAPVTVTHTIGVFALGVVTLALSQYVLAEDLYPWLTLISGLMVVTVGGAVLRSRLRHARAHAGGKHHHHHHHHDHDLSWKGLIGMGAAAGLIPCPSALVVLLAAISQHEVGLGLLLIVAFSLGLAGTLAGLGLAVVYARNVIPPRLAAGRLVAALPAVSALLIVTVGTVLTLRAVPEVV